MEVAETGVVNAQILAMTLGILLAVGVAVIIVVLVQRHRLAQRFADLVADVAHTEDLSGIGTWTRDVGKTESRWSAGMYRLFGLDSTTFKPELEAIRPLIHPDDLPSMVRLSNPAGAGGDAEVRIFHSDGGIRDLLVVTRFRSNRRGVVKDLIGTAIDITARKSAQRQVALREEQLQQAVSAMGAAVWERDLISDVLTAGDKWAEMLGHEVKEFQLTPELLRSLLHPDESAEVQEAWRRHVAEGSPVDLEYRMRHKDGHYIWIHLRGRQVRDARGRPIKMIGTVVEITGRREAGARLEKRAREATLLHEGVRLTAEAASLEAALQAVIDMVCATIDWPVGHVFTVAPGGGALQSTEIWHDPDPARYAVLRRINTGMTFAPGVGLPGDVWAARRPVWVSDIKSDPQFSHLMEIESLHTAVAFPIRVRGETRAIIEFFSDHLQTEDSDLLRVFESLGRQIGGVIERQETARNLMRQAREQYLLHAGMTLAAEAESFEEIIRRILDLVCETIGWPVGHAFVLPDPHAEELEPTGIWHLTDPERFKAFREITAQMRYKKGAGLPGRVWESQRPTWIEDVTKDSNAPRARIPGLTLLSAVSVPVHVGGAFRVVLEFFAESVQPRDADLLRVFGTLGLQVGSVIERQEAYSALQRSRASLELAIQAAEAGHFDIDEVTAKAFWSPRLRQMLGIKNLDIALTLQGMAKYIHPDDQAEFLADLEEYRLRDAPLDVETRIIKPAGELIWIHVRAVRQRDATGKPLRSVGFIRDISREKLAERALAESERKFRSLIEGSIQGLLIHRRFKPLFCNLAYARLLGYDRVEDLLEVESVLVFVPPDSQYDPDEVWRAAMARELDGKMRQVAIVDRHGERKWVETVGQIIDWEGEPAWQQTIMDVTERIERERELAAARDRLKNQADELAGLAQNLSFERERAEDASAAKSQFLAMMSHELRTPMTGVLGMADLLMMTGLSDEQKEMTQLLTRSARALLELLNDILDFSKIEAGQLEIESAAFRLGDVITDVRALFSTVAAEKGLLLETKLPPTYWNNVIGDSKRLRQVLSNLIGNALKFTTKGKITLTLTQQPVDDGGIRLCFAVADTGIGMSAADMERLFRPFVQADVSTARTYGGTGLGLAICKRLVTAMGGEISVTSTPGQGSVFSFNVRVGHDRLGDPQALPAKVDLVQPSGPKKAAVGRRILLAEDSETSRRLISMMLERLGHAVTTATNGAEAFEAVKTGDYDVVLMDMQMPVMDGPDATRAIRALGGDFSVLPVIALTADLIADSRGGYFDAGVNAIVGKPVDWNALEAEMTRVIDQAPRPGRPKTPAKPAKAEKKPVPAKEGPPEMAQPILLDEEMLKGLIDALGEDVFKPMISTFRANMIQYRDDLAAAVKEGDLRKAKRTAHALKGLCAQFGAPRASGLAKFIEVDSKSLAEIEPVLAQVAETVGATERALDARFPVKT